MGCARSQWLGTGNGVGLPQCGAPVAVGDHSDLVERLLLVLYQLGEETYQVLMMIIFKQMHLLTEEILEVHCLI